MTGLFQDVCYALRQMRRTPGFTALAVLTLALSIGASIAVFSVYDAVLLRPLPYRDPSRLVAIWSSEIRQPGSKIFAPYRDFEEFKSRSRSFDKLAALTWARGGEILSWNGSAHQVLAIPATADFFSVLGINATVGRVFGEEDLERGCTVVLSDSFWRNDLGAPNDVVGSSLDLTDHSCNVVGIMPRGFEFYPKRTSLWTLITPNSQYAKQPIDSVVGIFGRLHSGIGIAAAQRELVELHQRVSQESPPGSWVAQTTPIVRNLGEEFTWLAGRNLRISLLILCGGVALLLLIACLNVASLLLVRVDHRQRELAIRSAVGSGQSRLIRYLLAHSLLISSAGAALGMLVASVAIRYFNSANPVELPPGKQVSLNLAALGFAAMVAIVTGLVCGWLPALRVVRVNLNDVLKKSSTSSGSRTQRSGYVFVIAQAAVSMIVLAASGLLIASIAKLSDVPLGMETRQVLTAALSLPIKSYSQPAQRTLFYSELLTRVRALPAVKAVALGSALGPYNGGPSSELTVSGRAPFDNLEAINRVDISDEYFHVLSIPIQRGREFDNRDHAGSRRVAIVNEEFVRKYLPERDPLGQQIKLGNPGSDSPWLAIVGVVGSEKRTSVYQEMSYVEPALVYLPLDQATGSSISLLAKVEGNPVALAPLLRHEVAALDSGVPVSDIETMDKRYSEFLAQPRFRAVLMATIGGLTLLLAGLGFYGVLAHAVAQRTQEIGVRMALGAQKRSVIAKVIVQGATLAMIGIGCGTVVGLLLRRTMKSLLYGVGANDVGIFASAAGLLLCIALLACYIPARRAAKIDPMVALRYE